MTKLKAVVLLTLLIVSNIPLSFGVADDPVILTINGREITLSEFKYTFTKNIIHTQAADQKSIEEYLEIFINFHLKVHDAMQLGMDTHQTFIDELAGYRRQLAQRYLVDQNIINRLFDEAINRMNYDIRASQILISVSENAAPADTLAAWVRINQLRERILAGESFADLAKKYSDDPSARGMPATNQRPAIPPSYGDLGYFTVLDMVYPFETIAFQTPLNEISKPVRTSFGYHIIKVTDRLPAMGSARVAHIMIQTPWNAPQQQLDSAKKKIHEIYQKIKGGASFGDMAMLHSFDRASATQGGELPPFNSAGIVPEFVNAIADLGEPGSISTPVRTQFGWHIIKLIEKQQPTGDQAMANLKSRIQRDTRSQISQNALLDRIKSETGFVENRQLLEPFYNLVDDRIFQGKWEFEDNFNPDKVLFQFSDIKFTQSDFGKYLSRNQMRSRVPVPDHINSMYDGIVTEKLLNFEKDMLEKRNPEFRNILREYHDGMLLFELMNQKVWTRAVQDTVGLIKFFNENQNNYLWDKRVDAVIFTFSNEELAEKTRRRLRKIYRKDLPHDELVSELNADSQINVTAEKGLFEVNKKPLLGEIKLRRGVGRVFEWNEKYYIVQINDVLAPKPKKLEEIRGRVIADYQTYLDEEWIKELRNKYNYTVNKDALKTLKID